MDTPRLAVGQSIILREVYRGRTWALRPVVVAFDDGESVGVYFPPGTNWLRPTDADNLPLRLQPTDNRWRLSSVVNELPTLFVTRLADSHSIHLRWLLPAWDFDGWFVNLQEPIRRTAAGFEYLDHCLDIVVPPDRAWRWKDTDEIDEAVRTGVMDRATRDRVWREGQQVVPAIEKGEGVFAADWMRWRPDPAWPIPTLPTPDRLP